jgi:hypothetical protein
MLVLQLLQLPEVRLMMMNWPSIWAVYRVSPLGAPPVLLGRRRGLPGHKLPCSASSCSVQDARPVSQTLGDHRGQLAQQVGDGVCTSDGLRLDDGGLRRGPGRDLAAARAHAGCEPLNGAVSVHPASAKASSIAASRASGLSNRPSARPLPWPRSACTMISAGGELRWLPGHLQGGPALGHPLGPASGPFVTAPAVLRRRNLTSPP